jgi:hypothetical protein
VVLVVDVEVGTDRSLDLGGIAWFYSLDRQPTDPGASWAAGRGCNPAWGSELEAHLDECVFRHGRRGNRQAEFCRLGVTQMVVRR